MKRWIRFEGWFFKKPARDAHWGLARTRVFFFFAAATDYFLAVRTDGIRNARSHILLPIWCSQCVRYTSTRHLLSQHVLRPYCSKNLDVAGRIYNYTLTRARRMLECAFGIVCNKWRIFHCAINVCPDFCDAIVKTCCILHNFVRQRDGFQCQDTLCECPLESYGNR